jgi:carbonic anhydrase/acetyltransferase-like protein (isoleucine patch superfamily)
MTVYALGGAVPAIHPSAYVHPDATVVGRVSIGAGSSVWARAVVRGDVDTVWIGEQSAVLDGAVVHATVGHRTVVGDRVVVGPTAVLAGCSVEDEAFVGSGACVLTGGAVQSNAVVAAGAVVRRGQVVPSGATAVGAPATLSTAGIDHEVIADVRAAVQDVVEQYRQGLRRLD